MGRLGLRMDILYFPPSSSPSPFGDVCVARALSGFVTPACAPPLGWVTHPPLEAQAIRDGVGFGGEAPIPV